VRPPGAAFVVPVAAIAAVVAAVWPALAPVQASWRANRAMLVEARAELGRVPDAERGRLLADASSLATMRKELAALRAMLGSPGASRRVAEQVLKAARPS